MWSLQNRMYVLLNAIILCFLLEKAYFFIKMFGLYYNI